MKLYGVVIMDVVGSRKVLNRIQFQDNLIKYMDQVNEKLNKILATPISFTLGDEWQAITYLPFECYEIVHEFQQCLWQDDVDIYAGIGIGELTTEIYDDIRSMDGPCFHAARNAIEVARNWMRLSNKLIYSKNNKIYFQAQTESLPNLFEDSINDKFNLVLKHSYNLPENDDLLAWDEVSATNNNDKSYLTLGELLNTLIENNEILKARMTSKQKKIYRDYIKFGTYRKMIQEYGRQTSETIGGISQKLNSAEFFTIQRNQKIIKKLLVYYCALRGLV